MQPDDDLVDSFINDVYNIFEKRGIKHEIKYLLMVAKTIEEIEILEEERKKNDHELRSR